MFDFLLDLLFPRQCVSCGKWGKFICDGCRKKIEFFDQQVCPYCELNSPFSLTHPRCQKRYGLDGMFVLAHYRGPIREALKAAKYQGTYAVVSELASQLVNQYHHKFPFEYFIPVPLHPNREKERGFNQAEKIAKELAQRLDEIKDKSYQIQDKKKGIGKSIGVVNLLQRIRATKPQFDLKGKERQENVRGAFSLSSTMNPELVTAMNSFCLVDDVATTGSTIFECAKVLKKAGAKKVWAICVARGG